MAQPPVRADDPRFQLVPASAQAQGLLFALTVVLPLVLVLLLPQARFWTLPPRRPLTLGRVRRLAAACPKQPLCRNTAFRGRPCTR